MHQEKNQRNIKLHGAYNFRDMGGYAAQEGKTTKWGVIYRADELSRLSQNDLDILEKLKIKTIIDFRSPGEASKAPDQKPSTVIKTFSIPVVFGSMDSLLQSIDLTGEKFMMQINRSAIEEAQAQFKEFFRIISNSSNLPLIFHCAGGKDRAGIAAALFLSSIGVDMETIYKDYLLSAELIRKKYSDLAEINPKLTPSLTVKKEYLEAAFETMDKKYGGAESYLVNQLGVDLHLMRSIYIE